MDKIYEIPSTRNIFRPLLEIVDFIPPFTGLRDVTKDVLAELLAYYYFVYGNYSIEDRNLLIFNKETVDKMTYNINLTVPQFHNSISMLKKAGIILSDGYHRNRLNEQYILLPLESITFKFVSNGTIDK